MPLQRETHGHFPVVARQGCTDLLLFGRLDSGDCGAGLRDLRFHYPALLIDRFTSLVKGEVLWRAG